MFNPKLAPFPVSKLGADFCPVSNCRALKPPNGHCVNLGHPVLKLDLSYQFSNTQFWNWTHSFKTGLMYNEPKIVICPKLC